MKPPFVAVALLAAAFVIGQGTVRAEMIDFSYSWSAQPAVIPGGTGTVTLAVKPDGTSSAELGSMTPVAIPGADVTTSSSASDIPDTFSTPFNMKITLTDTKSGKAGELTFAGSMTGTLTATVSDLKSTFETPRTKELTLGDYIYSVTIDPDLILLPAPGSSAPALIDALVTVRAKSDTGGPIEDAPEPSSLVLGATALIGLATRRFLRTRPNPKGI